MLFLDGKTLHNEGYHVRQLLLGAESFVCLGRVQRRHGRSQQQPIKAFIDKRNNLSTLAWVTTYGDISCFLASDSAVTKVSSVKINVTSLSVGGAVNLRQTFITIFLRCHSIFWKLFWCPFLLQNTNCQASVFTKRTALVQCTLHFHESVPNFILLTSSIHHHHQGMVSKTVQNRKVSQTVTRLSHTTFQQSRNHFFDAAKYQNCYRNCTQTAGDPYHCPPVSRSTVQ